MSFEEYLKQEYGLDEPIYAEEIKFNGYSRSWIYGQIKKLVDAGTLKRFDNGIYFFPKKFFLGDTALSPRKVVQKKYLSDGENVYGYISGIAFENAAGLTPQYPAILEIVTNNESANVRDIKVGKQRVRARKPRATITKENANVLQFLDLMNIIEPKFLDEAAQFMFDRYIKNCGVTRNQLQQYVGLFPAKAMRNLIESGAIYELAQ